MITNREVILLGLISALRAALDSGGRDAGASALDDLFLFATEVQRVEGVPDPMPAGWNRPARASQRDVARVLLEAASRVEIGDSFEGTITWTMPTDEPELEGSEFGLIARYRVGNLDGQGGVRVWQPEP